MEEKNEKKKLDPVMLVCLIIGIALIIFAVVKLFSIWQGYKVSEDEYKEIANTYVDVNKDADIGDDTEDTPWYELAKVDIKGLQEQNPDVCGYILFENEDISYPVLHASDNDYYLHRTLEKTEAKAGSIFMECANDSDFEDSHTIVYGHNMKNGSMFAQLKKFSQNSDIYNQSKYFWIFTPEKNYRYEIISAYTTGVNSDTYTLFKGPGEEFEKYLQKIRGYSDIKTDGGELTIKDKIVTLSTCTGNEATRYVVQGKRVDTLDVAQ